MDDTVSLKKLKVEDQLKLVLENASDSKLVEKYIKSRGLKDIPGAKYIPRLFVDDIKGTISSSIMLPIENIMGKIVGVELRSLSDFNDIRYSKILLDEMIIYNFPNKHHESSCVITEGIIDCLTLYEEKINTVSALRAKVPKPVLHFLATIFDRVVVIFDNDDSGRLGALEIKKFYRKYYPDLELVIVKVPEKYKDVNEFKVKGKKKKWKEWVKDVKNSL